MKHGSHIMLQRLVRSTVSTEPRPYFTLEVGAQYNWGHILLEADVFGYFEGISSVKSGDWQPYADANGLQLIGLSLRMGWSEWRPR